MFLILFVFILYISDKITTKSTEDLEQQTSIDVTSECDDLSHNNNNNNKNHTGAKLISPVAGGDNNR